MKIVSEDYKNKILERDRSAKIKIVLSNGTTIERFYQNSFSYTNTCYQDGWIIGNNIAKKLEFEVVNNNYNLTNEDFKLYTGLKLSDGEIEWVLQGNFLVNEIENVVSSNTIKIKAFDYMIKFNGIYEDDHDYSTTPITLKQYILNFCQYYGVTLGTLTFPNENFVIDEKPDSDGLTGRQILKCIGEMLGMFAEIGVDNKLYFKLQNTNERYEINRSFVTSLTKNQETIPINSVVLKLGGGVSGENVSKQDDESIATYGENSLVIEDNIFLNTEEKRLNAIDGIYNQVLGFKYVAFAISEGTNPMFLETGDLITVPDKETGQTFDTILLSQTMKIPNITKSSLGAEAYTQNKEDYKYTSDEKVTQKHAELMVKKDLGLISAHVSSVDDKVNETVTTLESQQAKIEIMSTYIDPVTGQVTEVTTTNGFTFNNQGLNIYTSETSYNTLINTVGTYYRDGDTDIVKTTKDGSVLKNLSIIGQHKYSYNGSDYDFIDERIETDNGEFAYATFYNGE